MSSGKCENCGKSEWMHPAGLWTKHQVAIEAHREEKRRRKEREEQGAKMQMDIFESSKRADEGIQRSFDPTPETWKESARSILRRLAENQPSIVSDDVWEAGLEKPDNSATALGAVFRWAAKEQLIEKTDRVRSTAQVASHGSPMTIWKSKIWESPL